MRIFPFKSLSEVEVTAAELTSCGGFVHDREFALFDESGYVNGKREAKVAALRVAYDIPVTRAHFTSSLRDGRLEFELDGNPECLERWLDGHFGRSIVVHRERDGGFPDDTAAPGPTIISTATLAAVASWFPCLDLESVRRRMRANIEISNVPAFWEDRLFASAGTAVPFRIGDVLLEGTNPSARCIVPSRDPDTGESLPGFAKRVAERRAATLPPWADASRFDHFYRLAVNTRVTAQAGRLIRVGDAVAVSVERR